ncbi:MAG: hypothetical protein JWN73_2131, partial [Betaproteobacteria bacterium]|nr:hypothetical protein [Betaproteobacteria bacterium]
MSDTQQHQAAEAGRTTSNVAAIGGTAHGAPAGSAQGASAGPAQGAPAGAVHGGGRG